MTTGPTACRPVSGCYQLSLTLEEPHWRICFLRHASCEEFQKFHRFGPAITEGPFQKMSVESETGRVRFRFRENGSIGNEKCFFPEESVLLLLAKRQSPAFRFGPQSDHAVTNQQELVTGRNGFPGYKTSFFQLFVEDTRFRGRQGGKGRQRAERQGRALGVHEPYFILFYFGDSLLNSFSNQVNKLGDKLPVPLDA